MTDDELKEKDWQLLTAKSNIITIAYLQTIMQNQAVIISHLKDIPLSDVAEKMNEFTKENTKFTEDYISKNIPKYK